MHPPDTLAEFKDFHAGQSIVVCGCGASLNDLVDPHRFVTIGVNDVGRAFDPTYLVVLNPRKQFKGDRFQYVRDSRAQAVFSQLEVSLSYSRLVRLRLGQRGGTDFSDPNVLPFTRNSPYVALCLAIHMGARRIGLIGVDFTDHHFFAKTGCHPLAGEFVQIDREYCRLAKSALHQGVQVFNLSGQSRLTAFPKLPVDEFAAGSLSQSSPVEGSDPLRIVSYATTPVAGVPAILARCINSQTEHSARCVWAADSYGNGVRFAGDIEWTRAPEQAETALRKADLVIIHNGKVDERHRRLVVSKATITMAHNYAWNVDQFFVQQGDPGVVVGQYQATLPEFSGWLRVPNPIPLWESAFQPGKKGKTITICYTPSGKHERYPNGHRLYWHAKGYRTTLRILDRLAGRYSLKLKVLPGRPVSHAEALAMKRCSHIVIDECVTGSYHRNSLEGLAAGCVVVNGVGSLPGVAEVFQECAGVKGPLPFVRASLGSLESVLCKLIESGRQELMRRGEANRQWIEQHWSFARQWDRVWMPAVEKTKRAKKMAPLQAGLRFSAGQANDSAAATRSSAGQAPRSDKHASANPIPLYWTCRAGKCGNFGDMLSPIIVRALSGRPVRYASHGPRLFAVGSLLQSSHRGDLIWGNGFIGGNNRCQGGIFVYAVRGPLTRRRLLELGVECPEVYGDPALLLPWLYRLSSVIRTGIGIVPHYVDAAQVRAEVRDPAFRVIDIRSGIEEVLRQVNRCEVLLSSSLHGCVIGDAYGIPTAWVHISDKVVGGGFKFRDYYSATGREPTYVDWRNGIDVDAAVDAAVLAQPSKLDLGPLLHSFPYKRSSIRNLSDLPTRRLDDGLWRRAAAPSERKGIWSVGGNLPSRATRPIEGTLAGRQRPADRSVGKSEPTGGSCEPRLAVFGSCTEGYASYMVTSLRSFMEHNDGRPFDYYVFGHNFSARNRDLLDRFGIKYINLNLGGVFKRRKGSRYPSECFWIFKGPELFHQQGYTYSLSVDGDTYCNRRLDLDWLTGLAHIGGINRGCSVADFLSELGQYWKLKSNLGIPFRDSKRIATNSGVLFYNNKALVDLGFFDHLVEIFRRSESAGVERGGDDSTLALMFGVFPDIRLHVLDDLWNAYRGLYNSFLPRDPGYNRHLAHWIDSARIVHHSGSKPWNNVSHFPNRVNRHFFTLWRNLWRDTVRRPFRRSASPKHVARSTDSGFRVARGSGALPRGRSFHVRCYWYRGTKPNLGDETAPYLIKKIAGLPSSFRLPDPPRDPRKTSEPVLLSTGSVLRLCGGNSIVWGSGIRNIDQPVTNALRFSAVRGPLTRQRLLQLGYRCPEIYGDPALLLPQFFRPRSRKRFALGIVPHLLDYPLLSKVYRQHPKVLVIDVATSDIESFIEQVFSCDCTVSSALHGLVISVAYGIPTRWLRCSDKIMGDDTKFYDFFASLEPAVGRALNPVSVTLPEDDTDLEAYRPVRLQRDVIPPQELVEMTFSHTVSLDLKRLLDACPIGRSGWKDGIV